MVWAYISILDLKTTWTVDPKNFESLSSNTPMKGKILRGKAFATIVRGQVVMKEAKIQEGVFPFE